MDTDSEISTGPLVSVIMLTYNRAGYIREAIESVLAQSYTHLELVILDDGSTDNTSEMVAGFNDGRIRYVYDPVNKGLAAKRTESLSHIHGEYVAILDSDDRWNDPEKLAAQVAFMEANESCAVVGTFITLIDTAGQEIGQTTYHTTDAAIRATMLWRNQFANSSVLMRSSLVKKTAGYRDVAPSEDFELFLQLGQLGTFANIPHFSLQYRVHSGGESARKVIVAKQMLRVLSLHKNHYPGFYSASLKMCLLYVLARLHIR